MLNFYRDIWFEPSNTMGEILEMYYNLIMMYLIFIFFFLFLFLLYYFSNLWTSKTVVSYMMEFFFFIIPIFLLGLFLYFSMKALYMSEKFHGNMFSLKLTGNQWYWTVEFKQQIFNSYIQDAEYNYSFRNIDTSNHIFIPINTPTMILVTSQDVIHSVGFPDGGLKVDAIPGRLNSLEILSFSVGLFNGFCTELCGPLHAYMPFQIEFVI
uniref:Cytochrome c oxidase subunit 2 n=1 Tax=Bactrothrips quadrituberculatus TaxID=1246465 RepID=A0A8E5NLK0_9NEOP|nr:cytochrome c oxidase subunit II [Bactrothrips quadrituberculatus]QVD42816.1 cytochrome c oxidase subunit II [Bactrothrips quadrituberculatus]